MLYKQKWTKGYQADVKLQELLENGEANFEMAPMTMKGMTNEFKHYSDAVFMSHLNKLKTKAGDHLPDDKNYHVKYGRDASDP